MCRYRPGALAHRFLESLAPSRCAGCGTPAPAACEGCVRAIELLPQPGAVRIGGVSLNAAFLYTSPVRELLQRGKYQDCRSALRVLALLAAERFTTLPVPAAVVPLPLGRVRRRVRGYNQAEIAAVVIANLLGASVQPWLRRLRETESQVGQSPASRRRNLAGAFAWVGPSSQAGEVWVVDDVITTGATMLAALGAARHTTDVALRGIALARAGDHLRPPASRHHGIIAS